MGITTDLLFNEMENGMNGKNFHISNPYTRMGNAFTLRPAMFTLIGSTSGVGKSSFLDDLFILKPWRGHISKSEMVHWEVIYFSMERQKKFKIARWLSWLIYVDHGWKVPVPTLLGYGDKLISKELFKVVKGYGSEIDRLLELVTVYDGRITVKQLQNMLTQKALELGRYFVSDSSQWWEIKRGGITGPKKPLDKVRQVKRGKEVFPESYAMIEDKEITSNSYVYIPHNPNTLVQVVLDGVGLISTAEYKGNTKAAVDAVTNTLADARDRFNFSPVMVSQFNRGIADAQRVKNQKDMQGPQENDFKDSGNTYQAADLVIGLFDPYKHKAYDKEGMFGGYDMAKMRAPQGFCRFRSAHVLKNSFGFADVTYGMKYVGESSYFETLPLPSDPDVYEVYNGIAAGS